MCELMIKATNVTNADPVKDRRGCWKRGYFVGIKADGWDAGPYWADSDYPPSKGYFVYIKLPGVAVDNPNVLKYCQPQLEDTPDADGVYKVYRRRLWQLRWDDLPTPAKNKLKNNGFLTIKVGTYSGSYDYTWSQVKGYIRNLKTNLDETEDI